MLKTTSLVLAVPFTLDLTFVTNALANRIYLPIPLLIVAAIWYLVITSLLMVGQHFIERHYGKGVDNLVPAPVKATAGRDRRAHHAHRHGARRRRPHMSATTTERRTAIDAPPAEDSRWSGSRASTSTSAHTMCSAAST